MRISACAIVRDEERNIGRWLDNVRRVADEIIVVDTGSQDRTIDILREQGIEPYHFKWCDNFAMAKNYAVSKATGDWILFLDADEYFDDNSVKVFAAVMNKYHKMKKIGAILCRLINIDTDNMNKVTGSMLQVRIFRNVAQIAFEGAVHEHLVVQNGNYTMQYCKQLVICHTGYSSSIVKEKAARNLPILLAEEKKPADKPANALYLFLSDAYNALEQYDKALEYAKKAVQAGVYALGDAGHCYKNLVSAMARTNQPVDEIISVLDEALEKVPDSIFFMIEKGHFYYTVKDYLSALHWFEKAMLEHDKQREAMDAGELASNDVISLLPMLYGELADICLLRGQKQRALSLTLGGLEYHKYNRLLIRDLYKALAGREAVDIIQIFGCMYDRYRDGAYLINALTGLVSREFAAYYGGRCADDEKLKMFLQTGNYAGAAVISRRNLRIWQHLAAAVSQMQQTDGGGNAAEVKALLPELYRQQLDDKLEGNDDIEAVKRIISGMQK